MNTIMVQIRRGEEWRKLSSVTYDPNRSSQTPRGEITDYTREGARREALRQLTAWDSYFGGEPLGVVERAGYGGATVVIAGGRA